MRCLLCLVALAITTGIFQPVTLTASESRLPTTLQNLVGEDARYAIDFMIFRRVAWGHLRLSGTDHPRVFRAELEGKSLGVAAWLSGERTQTYTSLMEQAADGSLRTIEHVSHIVKRRWGKTQNRVHRYRYDYQAHKVFDDKSRDGAAEQHAEHDIPPGLVPVDILTAFYNLRIGAYGSLERGARLLIPTYARNRFTNIEVNVLTREQQAAQKNFPSDGLLIKVSIDPEIFDTGNGRMQVWFDDKGLPGRGIIEDLIGAGDIIGYFDMEGL